MISKPRRAAYWLQLTLTLAVCAFMTVPVVLSVLAGLTNNIFVGLSSGLTTRWLVEVWSLYRNTIFLSLGIALACLACTLVIGVPAAYYMALRRNRVTRLIEELLMLARFDAGQDRQAGEPQALDALIAETLLRASPAARERQVELVARSEAAGGAKVSHGSVGLVLANLVDNALKFSPRGSKIVVDCAADAHHATLRVTDEGPGIPPDELPFLFDRFFRGAGARASENEGVGLGLALSQSIIHAQGGHIEAANGPDGGAVFTVRIPLALREAGS